jgi:energy-coupling factor transporter transmembrane protein EcfT
MDGRIKLACMVLFALAAGISGRAIDLILINIVLATALISSGLPVKRLLAEIRRFLFLIGVIVIAHSYAIPGTPITQGTLITNFPIRAPSWEGLNSGLIFGWRLVLVLIASIILVGTTSLTTFKSVIEWFLRPVPFIREARVATMFSLTFVLIPLVLDEASEMLEAQKARCINGGKNPIRRIRFLIFPLLFQTFIRADEMVMAMESRCYSEVRTKAAFKAKFNDWFFLAFSAIVFTVVAFKLF